MDGGDDESLFFCGTGRRSVFDSVVVMESLERFLGGAAAVVAWQVRPLSDWW